MNELLKKNVETEIQMLKEVSLYLKKFEGANEYEKKLLNAAINSLLAGIKIVNSSFPKILEESIAKRKLSENKQKKTEEFEKVTYQREDANIEVALDKKSKEKFLKELSISERYITQIKKQEKFFEEDKASSFNTSRGYVKFANKIFLNKSNDLIKKGYFKEIDANLKKANIEILFGSYISTMLLSIVLSLVFSIILFAVLFVFDFSFSFPFLSFYQADYLVRFGKLFGIIVVIPAVTFLAFNVYPSSERKSISGKINQELPFAVIHMSAISGSGIAPVEIFKIIGMSREYPTLRKEIRKILNQINLYGYDLVAALIKTSKGVPNENLAELFSGIAASITSGASLQDFFEKRAETLLLNYRIERERYTKVIETFLDIYISVVIAAPMVFLLLLILMVVSGINVGFTSVQLSLISVFGIAVLNAFFLVFLQLKQPPY